MTLTAQTIQIVLAAIVLCFSSIAVHGQAQSPTGNSTINGIVVYSDTGRPLRHARITLLPEEAGWEQTAVSDLRGRFVFRDVPAGMCRLTIDAPGILTALMPRNEPFGRNRKFPIRDELVTEVSVNGTDSIEIKLQAVRGGVITGRVTTEDDQPLIDADIKLLRRENGKWVPEPGAWSNYRDRVGIERKTDAGGVYRIAGLRSGDYLVRVSEPVFGDDRIPGDEDSYSDGSFMVAYYPAAIGIKDAQPVSVVEGSESKGIDIRITERAPHTLMGTVTVAPDKTPAAGAPVTIERSDEIGYVTSSLLEGTTRTDAEGKWRFSGLPPGEYLVSIGGSVRIGSREHGGWIDTPPKRTTIRIEDKKINVLDTRLSLGAHIEGEAMLNGKSFDNDWGIYVGVDLDDKSATAKSVESESRLHTAWLRGEGMFEINGIPAGTYRFQIYIREDDKGYVKSVTRKGVDLMQTPFKLTEGGSYDDIVITLATDLANVEGQVTLAEKQSPSDVVVIIAAANDMTRRFGSGPRTLQPDAQGKISFKSAPGEYFMAAVQLAQYKKIQTQISYEYFDKNAEKFQRIKLRAGEKLKWGKIESISLAGL